MVIVALGAGLASGLLRMAGAANRLVHRCKVRHEFTGVTILIGLQIVSIRGV